MTYWEDYHTCVAIIGLYKSGKFTSHIIALSRPFKMSERFVYRIIERYREILAMSLIGLEAVALVRIKKVIEAVRLRIYRNPLSKRKVVTRKSKRIGVSHDSRWLRCACIQTVYKPFVDGPIKEN